MDRTYTSTKEGLVVIPDLCEIDGASDLASRIEWIALLQVLGTGRVDWREPAEVASVAELEADLAVEMLASLDAAGWVDCDDRDSGPAVCLSVLGAERLGVRIGEVGPGEVPIWRRADACEHRTRIRMLPRQVPLDPDPYPEIGDGDVEAPDWYHPEDPRPGPAELAERAEEAEIAWAAYRADPYPRLRPPMELWPSLILGINAVWNGPTAPGGVCPGCRGEPIGPHVACVYPECDRWGGVEKQPPLRRRKRARNGTHRPVSFGAPPTSSDPRPVGR